MTAFKFTLPRGRHQESIRKRATLRIDFGPAQNGAANGAANGSDFAARDMSGTPDLSGTLDLFGCSAAATHRKIMQSKLYMLGTYLQQYQHHKVDSTVARFGPAIDFERKV